MSDLTPSFPDPDATAEPLRAEILRWDAAGVADAGFVKAAPGSVLVQIAPDVAGCSGASSSRVWLLAAGSRDEVDAHPAAASARRIDLGRAVILPALVNAHTHLDLTHMGPRAFDAAGGFAGWVNVIRRERLSDPRAIAESVRQGVELSRVGGVAMVGDIAGCPASGPTDAAAVALADGGLAGVSFLEFFGIGRGSHRGIERAVGLLEKGRELAGGDVIVGLQPHASNTIGVDIYRRAFAIPDVPISTHLSEAPEEREFVGAGRGPQRELLERIGAWDNSILEDVGKGLSPVARLAAVLDSDAVRARRAPIILAHVNDCSDADLDLLAALRSSGVNLHVAYCPRASAYFKAHDHFGPHRYREMLRRGIPVVLGTDSIVNLPPETATTGISTLDELRLLAARDGTDPRTLLSMATIGAAAALGRDPEMFLLHGPRMIAGLIAIPADGPVKTPGVIRMALEARGRPQFLFDGNEYRLTRT